MNLQRITRIHVLIVGLALAVGVAVLFLIVLIPPRKQELSRILGRAEEAEAYAAKRPSVEQNLESEQKRETEVTQKYKDILDHRMPKIDLTDPITATMRLWDLPAEEEGLMARWFASTGAQVSGFAFQTWPTAMPSSFPDPNMRILPPLNWNLSVQVKDFPALMEWLRKLPKAPRFMVLQSVTIQGYHQRGQPLLANVPVTLYEWTGVEPAAVAAVAGTEGAAASPARGAGRGPGMGMPGMGMPGMGMPGMGGGPRGGGR